MNDFIHLVVIPFTGVGVNRGFRGQEWFDYRIRIFKEFTLKSLLNQKNKRFILWLTFRPEERSNPSTLRLLKYLEGKIAFVVTFHGLMWHDDKWNTDLKSRWLNIKRLWRSRDLNVKTLLEICYSKNRTLRERLRRAILDLSSILPASDNLLLTRIDSDDMFHQDAIEEIQNSDLSVFGAMAFQNGYVYKAETDELAEWNPDTNPPFFTIIFNSDTFFNAEKHLAHYQDFTTHEDIPGIFLTQALSDGKYCVLIHGQHISTNWDHPFRGKIIEDNLEKRRILNSFGL